MKVEFNKGGIREEGERWRLLLKPETEFEEQFLWSAVKIHTPITRLKVESSFECIAINLHVKETED